MSRPTQPLASQILLVLAAALLLLTSPSQALKFDLTASHQPGTQRCISQNIREKQLVVVTVSVPHGDHQKVDLEVFDEGPHANKYWHKLDITDDQKFAFTTHDEADVQFCFTNTVSPGIKVTQELKRSIALHVDTGAEALDMSDELKNKKLKPVELELMRLEALLHDVIDQMEEYKGRESALRDVNESTNSRVKWFNTFTIITLVASGVWQIAYLRSYFQAKKLI
ncbi:emp24/gp25L/p24 family/GOLD-domain-containing protein [Fimicolochytrium jonesii]|uniref:emp24/gp25L/p24 family/GOLD-domain-containing protein n=1 Tax=Fimicolochytrium jonesii TaxID=1396493 RepID=UPI0022FE0315|nr:emp24/gp25L/p24 family/GOLD-domain-containing protein [Fimicolochytrium jonesii]KAI8818251.1 emp24/gp25L/p24 family/GOLD-domain-containing protein [Fimicolochytrium jonesii]